ncbi:MAG: hypothetical protein KAS85_09600 [Rhodobacteraceae bacterium]|nr:hypothetical protein [Paracoccaceae bacterium]
MFEHGPLLLVRVESGRTLAGPTKAPNVNGKQAISASVQPVCLGTLLLVRVEKKTASSAAFNDTESQRESADVRFLTDCMPRGVIGHSR